MSVFDVLAPISLKQPLN